MAPLYLCPLCEKKRLPDDLYFHAKGAKGAKGAKFLFPFLSYSTLALKGSQFPLRRWVKSEATEGVDGFRYRFFISRRGRKERKVLFPFRIPRWRWRVANFVTTRVRREFIHPLPPAGYSRLSQGEKVGESVITVVTDCPPETGGTSEAEGVDGFRYPFVNGPLMARMRQIFTDCRQLSIICANRCYLCPLWAIFHVYICRLGK